MDDVHGLAEGPSPPGGEQDPGQVGFGVRRDRRRFSNAVLLGLAVAFLMAGLLGELDRLPDALLRVVFAVVAVAATLGILVLAAFLIANSVTMIRQEGGRPPICSPYWPAWASSGSQGCC